MPRKSEQTREGVFKSTKHEASANAFIAFTAKPKEEYPMLTL